MTSHQHPIRSRSAALGALGRLAIRAALVSASLAVALGAPSCGLFDGRSPDLFPDGVQSVGCREGAACEPEAPACTSDVRCNDALDPLGGDPAPTVSQPEPGPLEPEPSPHEPSGAEPSEAPGSLAPDGGDLPDDEEVPDGEAPPDGPAPPEPIGPDAGLDAGTAGGGRPRPPRPPRR